MPPSLDLYIGKDYYRLTYDNQIILEENTLKPHEHGRRRAIRCANKIQEMALVRPDINEYVDCTS